MDFGLLGPLAVSRGQEALQIQRGNQRAVLAALLLKANRTVSVDELAELLWGSDPPPSAQITVQNYVKRLRQALGPADRDRIGTRPRGYQIQVSEAELDVSRLEQLLAAAEAASQVGDWAAVSGQARAALALYRGEPLADIEAELLVRREAPRLVEMRLLAAEMRIAADLQLGRHAEVVGELRQLVAAHPLREHMHALLMQALAGSGRPGDALAAYRDARQILIAELATEPGQELRDIQQQILLCRPLGGRSGQGAERPAPDQTGATGPAVPRQLPAPVEAFAGRSRELAALTHLLSRGGLTGDDAYSARTVLISAIDGTAGVGKTALAVQWAHQVASRFPDGQLYINLRGYDPGQPLAASDVLAGFLRAFGIVGQEIPADLEERAALYRSTLAGRRVLVLLDNAHDLEQLRPLLPGTPGSVTLVTSRDSLAGLVAREGANRLDLDTLPAADAVSLLKSLIGDRVEAEPAAASMLADQCAGLPLALRIAAELAASRRDATLAELTSELADYHQRLDLLEAGGDPRTAVRAVFSWSIRHLDSPAADAFRLLGLHPAAEWDYFALAALSDTTVLEAARQMAGLIRAHLAHPTAPGRYGMHDLLRAYARDLTATLDPQLRSSSLTRLFDYYLHAVSAAMDSLSPAEKHRRPRLAPTALPLPQFSDPGTARAWLDARLGCLTAVVAEAAAGDWPTHAIMIAATLFRYLELGGHESEAWEIHGWALRAAEHQNDAGAEATAHLSLGATAYRRLDFELAAKHYELALRLSRQVEDRVAEARALSNLGSVALRRDDYQLADNRFRQAIRLHRSTGDQAGEAHARGNLGLAALTRDEFDKAATHLRRALALYQQTGNLSGKARCLGALGIIDLEQGRPAAACDRLQESLVLCQQLGDRVAEAYNLANLGVAEVRLSHRAEAEEHLRAGIAALSQVGDIGRELTAHNELGELLAEAGRADEARSEFEHALALADEVGDQPEDAERARAGLAGTTQ